jgi:hypothetical protein
LLAAFRLTQATETSRKPPFGSDKELTESRKMPSQSRLVAIDCRKLLAAPQKHLTGSRSVVADAR